MIGFIEGRADLIDFHSSSFRIYFKDIATSPNWAGERSPSVPIIREKSLRFQKQQPVTYLTPSVTQIWKLSNCRWGDELTMYVMQITAI